MFNALALTFSPLLYSRKCPDVDYGKHTYSPSIGDIKSLYSVRKYSHVSTFPIEYGGVLEKIISNTFAVEKAVKTEKTITL